MNLFDFKVQAQDGSIKDLSSLKGKVVLVVNTATECGFTPQYKELQECYDEMKEKGFEILDFPCNQFGDQTKGSDEEIHEFCSNRYGITFEQFSKIDVNGENADPLFKWITSTTKFQGFNGPSKVMMNMIAKKMDPDFKNNGNIKWNFTKILINRDGEIVDRFEPTFAMDKVRNRILEVL